MLISDSRVLFLCISLVEVVLARRARFSGFRLILSGFRYGCVQWDLLHGERGERRECLSRGSMWEVDVYDRFRF